VRVRAAEEETRSEGATEMTTDINSRRIHFSIYDPRGSMFKSCKNDKAESTVVTCSNSQSCDLYSRGECTFLYPLFPVRCLYGSMSRQYGYTRKAIRYSEWIRDQKKANDGVGFLKFPSERLAVIGDYIFLPYSHMTMCETVPFKAHSSLFSSGSCFLPKESFTVETIVTLINFRPMAMMGGEITTYQKEVPPKFLKHLSEQIPELFNPVMEKSEYARKRFAEFTNIGRKAILETLNPNVGKFKDCHGGLWEWDGSYLKSYNSHASFMLVNKFKELLLLPEEKQIVVIIDEKQVNENTVFVN
jgi:hypothetical protein